MNNESVRAELASRAGDVKATYSLARVADDWESLFEPVERPDTGR